MSDLRSSLTIFRLVSGSYGGLGSIQVNQILIYKSLCFLSLRLTSFKNIIKYSPASTIHDSRLPPSIMKGGDRMQEITAGAVHAVRKLA